MSLLFSKKPQFSAVDDVIIASIILIVGIVSKDDGAASVGN